MAKPHELKRQVAPAKIKVGTILYKYTASSWADGSSSVDAQEWHVRSIRKKAGSQSRYGIKQSNGLSEYYQIPFIHITQKNSSTWGKLSTKQFHRGFFKSISTYYKDKFRQGSKLPTGIFTTRLAAIRHAIKSKENDMMSTKKWMEKEKDDPTELAEWEEIFTDETKELRLLNTRLKKIQKEGKK